jgi:hypothetical protein
MLPTSGHKCSAKTTFPFHFQIIGRVFKITATVKVTACILFIGNGVVVGCVERDYI